MSIRMLALLLILALTPVTPGAAETSDYALRDLDGELHRVSDHRGVWLVINFWATWCAPCLHEMPELQRFYERNRERAHVWGVTFEDSERKTIEEYVERLGVTYPILGYEQDPQTGYGKVTVLPTTFIIDPEGLFFHRFEGPISAQDIEAIIPWQ